jgi:hypothetical protein
MKYRFITILHNLRLETIKNKGTEVFPGARLSNGTRVLEQTLEPIRYNLGIHSKDEFKDKTYLYIDGEYKDINTKEEMDEIGTERTYFFLRQAQFFVHQLWKIKDNNVYVRDGFLFAYNNRIDQGGVTYKASLSEIFTYATCEQKESIYTDTELQKAINDYTPPTLEDFDKDSFGGKYPNSNHLFKSNGSNRMDRAVYFTHYARKSHILPMKIVLYCTALECLFTVGKTEINHKIAERVAVMLGTSKESKKLLFDLIKDAYNYRSTVMHGQHLKGTESALIEFSKGLDGVLRKLIVDNNDIFSKSDKEMEKFFLDLLFADNK